MDNWFGMNVEHVVRIVGKSAKNSAVMHSWRG